MFLGACMSMLPNAGCAGFANAFPLGLAGVLENIGIDTTDVNVVECLPQRDKLQNLVTERACDSLMLVQESIRKNPYLYLCIHKGNKNGNKNLAKYIAWYDVDWKRVRTYLLDVDCTDKKTKDSAEAVLHSLKKVFLQTYRFYFTVSVPTVAEVVLFSHCFGN